jgi:hypothetical protein
MMRVAKRRLAIGPEQRVEPLRPDAREIAAGERLAGGALGRQLTALDGAGDVTRA